jgi:hypothetical protein
VRFSKGQASHKKKNVSTTRKYFSKFLCNKNFHLLNGSIERVGHNSKSFELCIKTTGTYIINHHISFIKNSYLNNSPSYSEIVSNERNYTLLIGYDVMSDLLSK